QDRIAGGHFNGGKEGHDRYTMSGKSEDVGASHRRRGGGVHEATAHRRANGWSTANYTKTGLAVVAAARDRPRGAPVRDRRRDDGTKSAQTPPFANRSRPRTSALRLSNPSPLGPRDADPGSRPNRTIASRTPAGAPR